MNDPEIVRVPLPHGPEPADTRAAMLLAYSYTKPVLDDSRTAAAAIGTGVLVGVGDRLFVLSAAHCLGPAPLVLTSPDFHYPAPPTPIRNRGRVPNRDIGFLEIENDQSVPRLPMECLSPDLPPIAADPRVPLGPTYWVIGFPVDEFTSVLGMRAFILRNYGTHPLRINEDEYLYAWPLEVARYDENTREYRHKEVTTKPHGYSGGGLWTFNTPPAESLSLPQNMLRLHGVQVEWDRTYRFVRCIPIRWWLKLIHDRYEDLRELLVARFAFLRGE